MKARAAAPTKAHPRGAGLGVWARRGTAPGSAPGGPASPIPGPEVASKRYRAIPSQLRLLVDGRATTRPVAREGRRRRAMRSRGARAGGRERGSPAPGSREGEVTPRRVGQGSAVQSRALKRGSSAPSRSPDGRGLLVPPLKGEKLRPPRPRGKRLSPAPEGEEAPPTPEPREAA